jgi:phage terminase large subunit GpA-like protein
VLGSTPVDEETSRVCRAYERSDQRVYECPCPHCGDFHEIAWKDIRWEPDRPETAAWVCPSCGVVTEEPGKAAMVQAGRWRSTRPEVEGHHGYRINALVSLLRNAAWPRLAAEFVEAKRSFTTLKAFTTTLLAEPWRSDGEEVDPATLTSRHRPHDLENLPEDTVAVTAGCDLQGDRIETTIVAWNSDGHARVLAHVIVWGSPLDDVTWQELDNLLRGHWIHREGGIIRIAAAVIDSGHYADQVYAFTRPRAGRRIVAGKGISGFNRPSLAWGRSRKTRLALIGVDAIKLAIHQRLAQGDTITISDKLADDYLEQLRAERLVTSFVRGQPSRHWEKISGRRNEALDCLTYAIAAFQLLPHDAIRSDGRVVNTVHSAWIGRKI